MQMNEMSPPAPWRNTRGKVQAARLRAGGGRAGQPAKRHTAGWQRRQSSPPTVPPAPQGLFITRGGSPEQVTAGPRPVVPTAPAQRRLARHAAAAQAEAATATPPATPPACASSSAALEAWGELASDGGTSCQNRCSALDQSARMALPLAEPANRGRRGGGGGAAQRPRREEASPNAACCWCQSHAASTPCSTATARCLHPRSRLQGRLCAHMRLDQAIPGHQPNKPSHPCSCQAQTARTGALHVRLNQAAQVGLARRRLHALDGHNLAIDQGGEVAWGWEGGGGSGG